jgi:iron uptake system component EfeO
MLSVTLAACGTGATAGPTGGATDAGSTHVVPVEAKEYQFTPAEVDLEAGSITFRVHNGGTEEHEFEIFRGDQVVDEIEGLVPGLTKDLTLTLEPGEYTFFCKLNGHDVLGMKGTLTVAAG